MAIQVPWIRFKKLELIILGLSQGCGQDGTTIHSVTKVRNLEIILDSLFPKHKNNYISHYYLYCNHGTGTITWTLHQPNFSFFHSNPQHNPIFTEQLEQAGLNFGTMTLWANNPLLEGAYWRMFSSIPCLYPLMPVAYIITPQSRQSKISANCSMSPVKQDITHSWESLN